MTGMYERPVMAPDDEPNSRELALTIQESLTLTEKTDFSRRDLVLNATAAAVATGALAAPLPASAQEISLPAKWAREADVVVIGAGAMGLTSAIVAREAGASVIVVEAEKHIGGHAITSGGNVPLGGGTSAQKKHGIEDSPDLLFHDLTDWSVVEPNGFPDYRYNDREIIRAFADNSAATYEWLVAHGVVFVDKAPDARGGNAVGNSVPREMHAAVMEPGRWCRPASRRIRRCKPRCHPATG